MQITRQADYALRALLYLAEQGAHTTCSTRKIAEEMQIPLSFLAKIIAQLSLSGLINTARGAKGGVSLAKSINAISMYDAVVAIDGPIHLNECTVEDEFCPFEDTCPIHQVWLEAEALLIGKLMKTTLSELLDRKSKRA